MFIEPAVDIRQADVDDGEIESNGDRELPDLGSPFRSDEPRARRGAGFRPGFRVHRGCPPR